MQGGGGHSPAEGSAWSWGWLHAERGGREETALGRLQEGCLSNVPLLEGGVWGFGPKQSSEEERMLLYMCRECVRSQTACCWEHGAPTCPKGWW